MKLDRVSVWLGVLVTVGSVVLGAWRITSSTKVQSALVAQAVENIGEKVSEMEMRQAVARANDRELYNEKLDGIGNELSDVQADLEVINLAAARGTQEAAAFLGGKLEQIRREQTEIKEAQGAIADSLSAFGGELETVEALVVHIIKADSARDALPDSIVGAIPEAPEKRRGWFRRLVGKIPGVD